MEVKYRFFFTDLLFNFIQLQLGSAIGAVYIKMFIALNYYFLLTYNVHIYDCTKFLHLQITKSA